MRIPHTTARSGTACLSEPPRVQDQDDPAQKLISLVSHRAARHRRRWENHQVATAGTVTIAVPVSRAPRRCGQGHHRW